MQPPVLLSHVFIYLVLKFILNLYLVFTKFLFCLIYCPPVVKFSVLISHVCYINVVLELYLNLYKLKHSVFHCVWFMTG